MRQILFRGKRKDNGEWVEGLLTVMWGEYHIINPDDENTAYPIDTDTICQYTELTDKSGNKIWENDVVCTPYIDPVFGDMVNDKILDDYTWKVVFVDGGFCVENEDKIINLRSFTNGNHIRAIGNIFDNADLLKGE